MDLKKFIANKGEKPLDIIKDDCGYCAIFRKIAFIGDSLSSGEFEALAKDGSRIYCDMFEYSWGQFIARKTGAFAYNFSRGGMSAKEYCDSFAEANGYWDKDKACQAYIIALGVNDLVNFRQETGSAADIDLKDWRNNRETFAGYYGRIVQRLKEISPDAKFFFVSMPRDDSFEFSLSKRHAEVLRELTEIFQNSYLIDLYTYAPVYDREFKENFYLHGHLNPQGYYLTAKMIGSYIDYIIRNNPSDFRQTGFIGTPHYSHDL